MNEDSLKSFVRDIRVKIAPEGVEQLKVTGNFFAMEEADGLALVRYRNSDNEFRAPVATAFELEPGDLFTGLEVRNPSTTETLNAIIKVGRGRFSDNRITAVAGRANLFMPQSPSDSAIDTALTSAVKGVNENPLRKGFNFIVPAGATVEFQDDLLNTIYFQKNSTADKQTYFYEYAGSGFIKATTSNVDFVELNYKL